jgi:hypothetical protein
MERAGQHDPHPIFMARASGLTREQKQAISSTFHVEIYQDDVWVVDRRAPQAPLDAYTFDEREPKIWEWYFVSGVEPVRKYVSDPFSTWEWRTHLGQAAALPTLAPKTLEQVRIAHNIAVATGDAGRAVEWRARLEQGLVKEPAAEYTQGISLLGIHRIGGTEPRIVLFLQSHDSLAGDATFAVRAIVEERKAWSLIPPDPIERDVALPSALSTSLYRPGFIYSQTVVLNQRIGVERFFGAFQSKDGSMPPVRTDGEPLTSLLVAR